MIVTVSEQTFDLKGVTDSSPVLKIFAVRSFVDTDDNNIIGSRFPQGSPVVEVTCAVVSEVLTVPEFDISSTTDSYTKNARYKAYLVREGTDSERLPFFINRFKMPHSFGATCTWEQIYSYGVDHTAPTVPLNFSLSSPSLLNARASWSESDDAGLGMKEYRLTLSYAE